MSLLNLRDGHSHGWSRFPIAAACRAALLILLLVRLDASEAHAQGVSTTSPTSAVDARSWVHESWTVKDGLVPTLLLWGEHDARSPASVGHQLGNAIPRCEMHLIPHAGHVSNMEQPDAFNAHVRHFCSAA